MADSVSGSVRPGFLVPKLLLSALRTKQAPGTGTESSENVLDAASTTSGDTSPAPERSARKRSRDDSSSSSCSVGGESSEGCETTRSPKRKRIETEEQIHGDDDIEGEDLHVLSSPELGGEGLDSALSAQVGEYLPEISIPSPGTQKDRTNGDSATNEPQKMPESRDENEAVNAENTSADSPGSAGTKDVEKSWSKDFLRQKYSNLGKKVKEILKEAREAPLEDEKYQDAVDKINILLAKYQQMLDPKKKVKKPRGTYPMTIEDSLKRNRGDEEMAHPWILPPDADLPNDGIQYRTWDKSSQCQILEVNFGFTSGGPHSNFKTADGRKKDLTCHASWGNREKTPFISSTPSIRDIIQIWIFGFRNRQKPPIDTVRVTIMNGRARIARGNLLVKMLPEILHYDVEIPIKCTYMTYQNEWLWPLRVWQEEIVWTFHYKDIAQWMEDSKTKDIELWEEKVAKPIFREHERCRLAGDDLEQTHVKLVSIMQKLMPSAVKTHWLASMQGCLLG